MDKIPFVDLRAQYQTIRAEIDAAIGRVIETSGFIGGEEVRAFNEEFGRYCGGHAVGVGNGTDAIYLAARALGIREGDEVIVPANTFIATSEAISQAGARPLFVDVDETHTLDVARVEAAITPRTKAIVAVHLYGQPADVEGLREIARRHGLKLIEDAAQAHGATFDGKRVGALGDVATFSFYPGKNLGAYGDAGAVVSGDAALIERVRMLANHGRKDKYLHEMEGVNSRIDGMQAAILRVKLRHLDAWTARRQTIARRYDALLREAECEIRTPYVAPGRTHVYHLYVIETDGRDLLQADLKAQGIETGIHYPVPLHLQPAYASHRLRAGAMPRAESAAKRILSLPMFPEMTEAQIERVAKGVLSFAGGR